MRDRAHIGVGPSLRFGELYERFSQPRAIAIDMESATNGFRLRVPYGTLLRVSDRPLHGEVKLRGMANSFYRELHSRKLRSFDEPAFR